MYEQFYGFSERPFDLTPDPRYLVATDIHREALSNLEYAILSRKGITLLVGEAGTGKTTVIRAAIERQPARVHCVHIHNPALTRAEFVTILAAQFALSDTARTSKADLLLELEQLLRRRQDENETSVLVVDEAQSLPFDLLDEIRLLTNIETNSEKLLSLVIAGQPEIAERFNSPSFRQLKQRIALRCELRPLIVNESVAYIAGRIRAAGGVPSQIFTREAVPPDSRAFRWHPAHDKRHRRQRPARWTGGAAEASRNAAGARCLPRFRYRYSPGDGCSRCAPGNRAAWSAPP